MTKKVALLVLTALAAPVLAQREPPVIEGSLGQGQIADAAGKRAHIGVDAARVKKRDGSEAVVGGSGFDIPPTQTTAPIGIRVKADRLAVSGKKATFGGKAELLTLDANKKRIRVPGTATV